MLFTNKDVYHVIQTIQSFLYSEMNKRRNFFFSFFGTSICCSRAYNIGDENEINPNNFLWLNYIPKFVYKVRYIETMNKQSNLLCMKLVNT